MRRIYLDYQATTPVRPEARAAMEPYWGEHFGNAASLHEAGVRARDALQTAREQMATLIQAPSANDILFTSDGTESANLAVLGAALANQRRGRHLVVSAAEHPAVQQSVDLLERQGFTVSRLGLDAWGRVRPAEIAAALTPETILVAVQMASPDLGTLQPVAEIGRLLTGSSTLFYVDAEAAAGWVPVEVTAMGAHLLSFSPHKFYGPKGVGVLYRHPRARLIPQLVGGAQENGLRSGTENIPAIVGAGVAAELASRELASRQTHVRALQQHLWEGVQKCIPQAQLNGPPPGPDRVPQTVSVSLEFVEGEAVVLACDLQGVAFHSGAACVSKTLKVPPVLRALGMDPGLAAGTVLFSLGVETTVEDLNEALDVVVRVVAKLRAMSPLWDDFQRGVIPSKIAS
jgi:cysteine desulfurase